MKKKEFAYLTLNLYHMYYIRNAMYLFIYLFYVFFGGGGDDVDLYL